MKLQKITAPLILTSMALNSCSESRVEEKPVYVPKETITHQETIIVQEATTATEVENEVIEESVFDKLTHGPGSNLALAKILTKDFKPIEVKKSEGYGDQVKDFFNQRSYFNNDLRLQYIFGDHDYENKAGLVHNSLLKSFTNGKSQYLESEIEYRMKAISLERSQILSQIEETYLNRMQEVSKAIATELLNENADNDAFKKDLIQATSAKSKAEFVQWVSQRREVLDKANNYLKRSGLTLKDQAFATFTGSLSLGIYMYMSDDKDLSELKKVATNVKETVKKVKEIYALIKVIDTYQETMKEESKNLFAYTQNATETLKTAIQKVENNFVYSSEEKQNFIDSLYKRVIKGEKPSEESRSILEEEFAFIDENVLGAFSSAQKMADSVSMIAKTSFALADKLGIKLPSELMDVAEKAAEVGSTINAVSSVLSGFASGGIMGGLSALTSSTVMKAFGLGQKEDPMNKAILNKLGVIDQKLDLVLQNQKAILETQIETMKMIQDLALMVDEYHQQEMVALLEVRDITAVSREVGRVLLNAPIKQCEYLVKKVLSEDRDLFDYNPYGNMALTNSLAKDFQAKLSGYKTIVNFLKTDTASSFETCKTGLQNVFLNDKIEESPVASIFNSKIEDNNLRSKIESYDPLVEILKENVVGDVNLMGLHIPMNTIKSFKSYKEGLLNGSDPALSDQVLYNIETLIHPTALMRYLNSLAVFHPYLESKFDGSFDNAEEFVGDFVETRTNYTFGGTTGYNMMIRALHLIQSAIAQEALLAGEPLLSYAVKNPAKVFSPIDENLCERGKVQATNLQSCAMKKNNIFILNMLTSFLYYRSEEVNSFRGDYRAALENSDAVAMKRVLGSEFNIIVNDKGELAISTFTNNAHAIVLPSLKAIAETKIRYSTDMEKLVIAHTKISEMLTDHIPQEFNSPEEELTSQIILAQ